MIDHFVVGGFYRVHASRGHDQSLNAPGMHPARLLEVKQCVLKSKLRDIVPQVSRMLRAEDPDRLRAMLVRLNE